MKLSSLERDDLVGRQRILPMKRGGAGIEPAHRFTVENLSGSLQ